MKITSTIRPPSQPARQKASASPRTGLSRPEPDVPTEHTDAIKTALTLSYLVYDKLPNVDAVLAERGHTHISTVSRWWVSGAQTTVSLKDGTAFVVFRGSVSLLDWIIDLLMLPFFWPLQHLGFGFAWRSVRGTVNRWMAQNHDNIERVFLCGHSLGGAMAHLAARDLGTRYPIDSVITFGAPKAWFISGDSRYKNQQIFNQPDKTLQDVTYSIVNQRDVVATVPPGWFGYREIGQLIYVDQNGQINHGDKAWKARFSDSMTNIDTMFNFMEHEQQALTYSRSVGHSQVQTSIRSKVVWAADHIPLFKHIALPFVLYISLTYYFARSGLAHLSAQYIDAFFGHGEALDYLHQPPSTVMRVTGGLLRGVLLIAGSGAFIYGLYLIGFWISQGEIWHR